MVVVVVSNQLDLLDLLTICSVMLQLENYQQEIRSTKNDDLMNELKKQDTEYFEKILHNQQMIIDLLGAGKPAPDRR